MKHVNFKKWGLAGCLLVALGTNLSFNPDSKIIARNDGFSGAMSLASTNEINLQNKYKGLKVKVQLNADKTSARYMIEKSGETEASVCISCVEEMGPVTVSLDPMDKENMEFIERTIKVDAVAKLEKLEAADPAAKVEKKDDKKITRTKKEDTSIAATFDMDEYRCERPEDSTDTSELSDYKECLADNLKDLREACKDAVAEKYDKDRAAAGDKKKFSVRKDTTSCDKLSRVYYNEEIRPALRMTKKIQLNNALQTYNNQYEMAYNSALQAGLSPEKAAEAARARAGFVTSQLITGLTATDLNSLIPGGLAGIHNRMSNYTNDTQYVNSFRMEYADPMTNLRTSLINSTVNSPQPINAQDLFQQYMSDINTPIITSQGIRTVPAQPTNAPIIINRPVIGNGIPQSGTPGARLNTPAMPTLQQPVQSNLPTTTRIGGTLPGPSL